MGATRHWKLAGRNIDSCLPRNSRLRGETLETINRASSNGDAMSPHYSDPRRVSNSHGEGFLRADGMTAVADWLTDSEIADIFGDSAAARHQPAPATPLEYKARKVTCSPCADPTPWVCKHGRDRRTCYACQKSKALRVGGNIHRRAAVSDNRYYSLTLTHQHHDLAPAAQVKALLAAFNKLRRLASFRYIVGGVRSLDVTSTTDGWNVHLHVLAETTELSNDVTYAITRDWRRVIGADGDSAPAHFSEITSDDYLRNCSYYVGGMKGSKSKLSLLPPAAMDEWGKATKGMRVRATFGSFRGTRLTAYTPPAIDDAPTETDDGSIKVSPDCDSPTAPTETDDSSTETDASGDNTENAEPAGAAVATRGRQGMAACTGADQTREEDLDLDPARQPIAINGAAAWRFDTS